MPLMTYLRGAGDSALRIFLAIPTGSGSIHAPCVASLLEAVPVLNAAGIRVDTCIEAGNCHVDDARNSLVRQFMQTDCTDLVFIDADVGFRSEDLLRLVRFDRDLVAGVYPKKQDDTSFPVMTEPGKPLYAEADGCVEVMGAPTGFMRIRRGVLEKMLAKYSARSFMGQGGESSLYTLLFEREIAEGRRWSGDYNFCRRWRKLGGKVYVDPTMQFTHEGLKQWSGCLGDYWKQAHGVTAQLKDEAFASALSRCKQGNPTAEDFLTLADAWDNPWAASPEFLATAYKLAQDADGPILECGSGLSTVVMAAAGAKVHALEHDPIWAMRVRDVLDDHGLSAELECHRLKDGWYEPPKGKFPLVVIDGPPRKLGDRSKAYEYASGVVLVDDTQDPVQADALHAFAGDRPVTHIGAGNNRQFSVLL